MNVRTSQLELKFLSESFYQNHAPKIKEILFKDTRPYCVLLVKVKGLQFALPLRSHIPDREGCGFKTIEHQESKEQRKKFKGIDFSKAILISDDSFLKHDHVVLKDKNEWIFIIGNGKKIAKEFKHYVEGYITALKNNNVLDSKYEFTTLINYHKELKIE